MYWIIVLFSVCQLKMSNNCCSFLLACFIVVAGVVGDYGADLAPLEPTLNVSKLLSQQACSNATLDIFVASLVPLSSNNLLEGIFSGIVRPQMCVDSSCSDALFSSLNVGVNFGPEVPENILELISTEFCASDCLANFVQNVATEASSVVFQNELQTFCSNLQCSQREELQQYWQAVAKVLELFKPISQPNSTWQLFLCPANSCEQRQSGDECISQNTGTPTDCTYCSESYSCTTSGYVNTCPSECAICDTVGGCEELEDIYTDVVPPPKEWDYNCSNGGTKFYTSNFPSPESSPNQRFGGTDCICPSEWTGHDCSVCRSDSTCTASQSKNPSLGSSCNFGWIPTDTIPLRNLKCFCDSNTCEDILESGAEEASITLSFEQGSLAEQIDVKFLMHKRVPNPNDRFKETGSIQRQSSFFLGASARDCSSLLGVYCTQAVGAGPWSDNDICNVLSCNSVDLLCPPSTPSLLSGERYDFYNAVCGNALLQSALNPPFELVCVEGNYEKNSVGEIITVNKQRTCSFATKTIGHGTFALQCLSGSCEDDLSGSTLSIRDLPSDCPFDVSFQTCKTIKLSLLCLAPVILAVGIVGTCLLLSRNTKGRVKPYSYATSAQKGFQTSPPNMVDQYQASEGEGRTVGKPNVSKNSKLELSVPEDRYLYVAFKEVEFSIEKRNSTIGGLINPFANRNSKHNLKILRRVTGYLGGPEMLCILGASGSGKTTLIDILAGRKTLGVINSGGIAIGNEYATPALLRAYCGYVMQDSVLPGTQTVYEYLKFHAYLRTTASASASIDAVRERKIEEVVNAMGLNKCLDTLIGDYYIKGISGGEKRRTSIAVELLAGKKLVLLDEPTSGLDSTASIQVMSSLRRICRLGTGVAASIHQPSSKLFYMFDRVLILSRHGYTLYMGPASEMMNYFDSLGYRIPKSQYNPAEFALEMATMEDTRKLNKVVLNYFDSEQFHNEVESMNRVVKYDFIAAQTPTGSDDSLYASLIQPTTPSFLRQFVALGIRFTSNAVRHPVLPMVHVISTLIVCGMAALLYLDITDNLGGAINRAGFFFFIMVYLTLTALADLGVWFEERLIFTREQSSGCYNGTAYLLAKFFCEILPLRLAPLSAGTFILVFGIGLQDDPERVKNLFFALLFISLISVMAFLVIGMLIRSNGTANFAAVIMALFSLLMSGFLLIDFGSFAAGSQSAKTDNFLPTLLGYFSFLRPAFEILMVNELSGLIFQVTLVSENGAPVSDASIPASGDLVLAQLNLQPDDLPKDFLALIAWLILLLAFAATLLSFVVREKR